MASSVFSDATLSRDVYYRKYWRYIVLLQSLVRGKLTRRRVERVFKNHRYRKNVVKEIISTEQGYVNDLDVINNYVKKKVAEVRVSP